jgi:hypothetical protein
VPLIKWFTFGQWAKIMAALLGEDAEITAVTGQSRFSREWRNWP